MLTKTIANCLWVDPKTWNDNNYLVQIICIEFTKLDKREPNYASIIRIAHRLKKQPRFRRRYGVLRTDYLDRIQ